MKEKEIIVHFINTEHDIERFWQELYKYFDRDILINAGDEDKEYFFGDEYRKSIESAHNRKDNKCYYLNFYENDMEIGFAMPVIYNKEDNKCFIMEFCIYPQFRGNGTGSACFHALWSWAKENGASYAELNYCGNERRLRFWQRLGFIKNGVDEWGDPLLLLPPSDDVSITIEILKEADWQLYKLENSYLAEIEEAPLDDEKKDRLNAAIKKKAITFFVAKRDYRSVGMCSIAKAFSTFTCEEIGIFEDFYIEKAFRKQGIAKLLAKTAQEWSKEQGLASLTVCCAPCDIDMYRAFGFDIELGKTFAHIN